MKKNLVSFVSIAAFILIAGSAVYLSQKVKNTDTTVGKSQASMLLPNITQSFVDAFKTDAVNEDKWNVVKNGNVTIAQTSANNLRIDIPAGAQNDKQKSGILTFKDPLKDAGDFRIAVSLYKPIVKGQGYGVSGIRFASTGTDNDEGASVRWIVNDTTSRIVFQVNDATGKVIMQKSADVKTNIAIVALVRVNKTYRAWYKYGNDFSGDVSNIFLGEIENNSVGQDGYVSLFTTNSGAGKNYPGVIGRFDTASIGWEGAAASSVSFSDAFAGGNIGPKWKANATAGTAVVETKQDNLNINVSAGSVNDKVRYGIATRLSPAVPDNKDFSFTSTLVKPVVTGEGTGYAGIQFLSSGNTDDEAARVIWSVKDNKSTLVFAVRAPDNTLLERGSADVTANRLTLQLRRNGHTYGAYYRTGDSDTDWVRIGEETAGTLGGDGRVSLFASNAGVDKKFPRVIAKFDTAMGSVKK